MSENCIAKMAKLDQRMGIFLKEVKDFIRACKENKLTSAELARANKTLNTASVNQFLKHYELSAEERQKIAEIRIVFS